MYFKQEFKILVNVLRTVNLVGIPFSPCNQDAAAHNPGWIGGWVGEGEGARSGQFPEALCSVLRALISELNFSAPMRLPQKSSV